MFKVSLSKNRKRVGVIVGLIALIIVVVVGIGGWAIYRNHHKTASTKAATSSSRSATSVTSKSSPATSTSTSTNTNTTTNANSTAQTSPTAAQQPTALEQQAAANIKGYDSLPSDFKPLILTQFQKVVDGCANNPDAKAQGITASMQLSQIVRNKFISINEQQPDCEGGAEFYYSKVNNTWQYDFISTGMTPSCDQVNTFNYTKDILPNCYPANSSTTIPNTNP